MKIEKIVIPETKKLAFHSTEITIGEGETLEQALKRCYPDILVSTPPQGKVYILTMMLRGREVDL